MKSSVSVWPNCVRQTRTSFCFYPVGQSIYIRAIHSSGPKIPLKCNRETFVIFLTHPDVSRERAMDASQSVQLTHAQLIALVIALICEFARRLGETITVRASVGDAPASENVTMESGMVPVASSGIVEPMAGTPCSWTCTVDGCSNWCAGQGEHDRHHCRYHQWYWPSFRWFSKTFSWGCAGFGDSSCFSCRCCWKRWQVRRVPRMKWNDR